MLRCGLVSQGLDRGKLRRIDVLRINRNKRVTSASRYYLSAQASEDFGQEISPHGGVLVNEKPLAPERSAREEGRKPLDPSGAGFDEFGWQVSVAGLEETALIKLRLFQTLLIKPFTDAPDLRVDRSLLLLAEFALARIDLVAIPVERNVAAGYHDAALVPRERIER
jgi:hypothetical protein